MSAASLDTVNGLGVWGFLLTLSRWVSSCRGILSKSSSGFSELTGGLWSSHQSLMAEVSPWSSGHEVWVSVPVDSNGKDQGMDLFPLPHSYCCRRIWNLRLPIAVAILYVLGCPSSTQLALRYSAPDSKFNHETAQFCSQQSSIQNILATYKSYLKINKGKRHA